MAALVTTNWARATASRGRAIGGQALGLSQPSRESGVSADAKAVRRAVRAAKVVPRSGCPLDCPALRRPTLAAIAAAGSGQERADVAVYASQGNAQSAPGRGR